MMNRIKLFNGLIVLSSLFGYLEWGEDMHMFLFKGEVDILYGLITNPSTVLHPFTLLPLAGQILLLATLFRKKSPNWITYLGISMIGLLLILMLVISIIGPNWKIMVSTLPFITLSFFQILNLRKSRQG